MYIIIYSKTDNRGSIGVILINFQTKFIIIVNSLKLYYDTYDG